MTRQYIPRGHYYLTGLVGLLYCRITSLCITTTICPRSPWRRSLRLPRSCTPSVSGRSLTAICCTVPPRWIRLRMMLPYLNKMDLWYGSYTIRCRYKCTQYKTFSWYLETADWQKHVVYSLIITVSVRVCESIQTERFSMVLLCTPYWALTGFLSASF